MQREASGKNTRLTVGGLSVAILTVLDGIGSAGSDTSLAVIGSFTIIVVTMLIADSYRPMRK